MSNNKSLCAYSILFFYFFTMVFVNAEVRPSLKQVENFHERWLKQKHPKDVNSLALGIKGAKLYNHCDVGFGLAAIGKIYLNPIPVDANGKKRYFFLRFRTEKGQLVRILYEVDWDVELESKYHEMFFIQYEFHTLFHTARQKNLLFV